MPENDPAQEVRLLCSCTGRWRSLGEARASQAYGVDKKLTNIELATWLRRLAFEVGLLAPVEVYVPRVGPSAPQAARDARDGFALLIRIRRADYEARPIPYSVRFAGAWCRLSHRDAHLGIKWLRDFHVIEKVQEANGLWLYEAGIGPLGRAGSEDALVATFLREFDAVELTPEGAECPKGAAGRMMPPGVRR